MSSATRRPSSARRTAFDDRIATVFEEIADSIGNEAEVLLWARHMEDFAKGLTIDP